MKLYFDTNVHSKIATGPDASEVAATIRRLNADVLIADTIFEEVLLAPPSVLRDLGPWITHLLNDQPHLAPVTHQIEWSIPFFLDDSTIPPPLFSAYRSNSVLQMLRQAEHLPAALLQELRSKRDRSASDWDEMHSNGRESLQAALRSGLAVPEPREWIEGLLDSEFATNSVMAVAEPEHRRQLRDQVQEFIEWQPLCRSYLELYFLAIRRHGILAEHLASRKGPKWPDYSHGSFAAVVDVFVTDDQRFRDALVEHRDARPDARWQIMDLDSFTWWFRQQAAPLA